ncbi:MAG TPA: glutamate 5-kinase [Oculatellaceae cyanobacterium]
MDEKAQLDRKKLISGAHRIVVKLGTAVLINESSGLALSRFYSFVEAIGALKAAGKEVLIVTSGAIGLGVRKLGLKTKPKLLPQKQACAAVGQGLLMSLYADAFERLNIPIAQILLTEEDFSNRQRYLNLRSTVNELLTMGVIPVFNENDTVSTAEIESQKEGTRINFGDNDKLSALIASKIQADLLLILTDVAGLYTDDPRTVDSAKLIPLVEKITPEIEALVFSESAGKAKMGRGGMATKLEAAKIATQSGCITVVAGGKEPDVITRLAQGEELGTVFVSKEGLRGKQRWIAFATTVRSSMSVNNGAKEALIRRKASLLPAGVIKISGEFERGDVVSIVDEGGIEFARGMVNYSSGEAEKLVGLNSAVINDVVDPDHRNYDALVTRDNLVIFDHARV